ncbi:hypothetical protein K8R62_03345 [bacterium]|nr:hypothetical protein [bacterium]
MKNVKKDDFLMKLFKKFWERVVKTFNDGTAQAGKIDPKEGKIYIK